MRKPYPSEEQDRFMVRLPDGMRERISEEAEKNRRTMNAEIVARLEKSFEAKDQSGQARPVVPTPKHEERLHAVESAVLSALDQLSQIREKLGMDD